MSEAIIRTPFRDETESLVSRANRLSLAWLTWLEELAQRRKDRRLLATMSDGELADIGIGRSEIDGVTQPAPSPL